MKEAKKATEFKKSAIVKSSIGVFVSNLILVVTGIITGFIVPNFLGVLQYGYFETFTLYASYTTFFQLGFINGIYLVFGDKNYEELDKKKFRMFFKFFFFLELIISAILIVSGIICIQFNNLYGTILIFLAFYNLSMNVMTYFQIISQITMRFKEFSTRTIFQSIFKIIIVIILFVTFYLNNKSDINYIFYLILYVSMIVGMALWYVFSYKDIIFGESDKIIEHKTELLDIFKTGVPLLLADIIVVFIYRVDRQVVDVFFPKETFGLFSFAYAILSLIVTTIQSLNTVFYPILKRSSDDLLKHSRTLNSIIVHLSGLACAGYFVICFVVQKFMPKYYESLHTLLILFPIMIVTATINIGYQNIFKTIKKNSVYSIIAAIIFLIAVGLDIAAYFIFQNVDAISYATLISFWLWYAIMFVYLKKTINFKNYKNTALMLFYTILFFFIVFFGKNLLLDATTYLIISVAAIVFFEKDSIINIPSVNKILSRFQIKGNRTVQANKKLNFFVLVLISIFMIPFVSGPLIFDSRVESISSLVSDTAAKSEQGFVFSKIFPENPKLSLQSFFNVTRNNYGIDLKKVANCYIESSISGDEAPLILYSNKSLESIPLNTISTPTNSPSSLYLDFVFYNGSIFEDNYYFYINANEIYLPEIVVDRLFDIDYSLGDDRYKELIGEEIATKTPNGGISNFILKGVINSESLGFLGEMYNGMIAITNLTFSINYLAGYDKTIDVVYYPGKTSLTTYMIIHESMLKTKQFSQLFFDYIDGQYLESSTQSKINYINWFYGTQWLRIACFFVFVLFAVIISFLFIRTTIKENGGILSISGSYMPMVCAVFLILVLLFRTIDFLAIGSFVILLNSYYGMFCGLLVFVAMLVLPLFFKQKNKNNDTSNCRANYFEVDI